MKSSSTLSSLGRLYQHANHSSASVVSRLSKSSTRPSLQTCNDNNKILDIGKPTQFEHGIHVEYNKDNGKYMGLPDVWQSNLPSDDVLDTNYINPNLVPSPVNGKKKKKNFFYISTLYDKKPSLIGKPYNIQHHIHVEVDQNGFKGLPLEWQKILKASGISEDIVNANPKAVQRLMHVRMPDSLQQQRQQQDTKSDHTNNNDKISELPIGFAPPSRARHSKLAPLRRPSSSFIDSTSSVSLASSHTSTSDIESPIDDIIDHADPTQLYTDFTLIAEGESGPMYAAKQISTNRIVAIKKISKDAEQKLGKVRNELTTMKMSRHPNIVEFIACYITDTEVWVVMEYMDVALSDIISIETTNNNDDNDDDMEQKDYRERMTEDQMGRVARDILRALGKLDRLGRIHRDIRSDNVLINMRGEIKLTDFSHCAQLTKNQPKRNSIIGTPYWMAPEVIKGQEYNAKADIWSLGVLMIEMSQGDPPYVEYPPLRALFLIASNGIPPFSEPDRWSEQFKDFVQKCTTVDPTKRPDAATLLRHPFVLSVATKEDIVKLIEETRQLEEMMDSEEEDDS
ncbi:kinase-like domain-containing protein [Halteromyces radiatus]|uniref:kinase-like domain-containing protein n=1 Tax=Halteromyces radiatus TaxID=101107 RepID=UPI00221F7D79|nr:kinase-like domain-containing protein [Halteromyces radiatus]KAI8079941.1 kinase-like domain-containing protein [Halteromyces radiatus]